MPITRMVHCATTIAAVMVTTCSVPSTPTIPAAAIATRSFLYPPMPSLFPHSCESPMPFPISPHHAHPTTCLPFFQPTREAPMRHREPLHFLLSNMYCVPSMSTILEPAPLVSLTPRWPCISTMTTMITGAEAAPATLPTPSTTMMPTIAAAGRHHRRTYQAHPTTRPRTQKRHSQTWRLQAEADSYHRRTLTRPR